MRVRPLIVAAACSFVAALALVISEGAVLGVHSPQGAAEGSARALNSQSGNSSTLDKAPDASGAFGADEASAPPDAQTADQTDQSTTGGDTSQSTQSGPAIDTGAISQVLPPIKIGP